VVTRGGSFVRARRWFLVGRGVGSLVFFFPGGAGGGERVFSNHTPPHDNKTQQVTHSHTRGGEGRFSPKTQPKQPNPPHHKSTKTPRPHPPPQPGGCGTPTKQIYPPRGGGGPPFLFFAPQRPCHFISRRVTIKKNTKPNPKPRKNKNNKKKKNPSRGGWFFYCLVFVGGGFFLKGFCFGVGSLGFFFF